MSRKLKFNWKKEWKVLTLLVIIHLAPLVSALFFGFTPAKAHATETPIVLLEEMIIEEIVTPSLAQLQILYAVDRHLMSREELEAHRCLSLNGYHEARGSSLEDETAVGYVVLNRTAHSKFPSEICSVVWEPWQFSWTHDGISDVPYEKEAWERSQFIAWGVMNGLFEPPPGKPTHYHAHYINPYWASKASYSEQIGQHVFMRLPNRWI